MSATEVVYTWLPTAFTASNNKPATCIIHIHTSVLDIPQVSICSTGHSAVPGPLAGPRRLAVDADRLINAKHQMGLGWGGGHPKDCGSQLGWVSSRRCQ